jgi:hypothetical protein
VIAAIAKLNASRFSSSRTQLPARSHGRQCEGGAAGMDPSLPGSFFVNSAPARTGLFMIAEARHDHCAQQRDDADADANIGRRAARRHVPRISAGSITAGIEMFYEPNAVTDGDSIVVFRRADVIAAGDIFNTTQYPMIDPKNGGGVEGEIKALNDILNRTNFEHEGEGGTYIVPGHGFLSDEHEVTEYRDMVVIVRDRVKAMIAGGATLAQVKAARLTADYDTRYGTNTGPWTTDMFITAVAAQGRRLPRRAPGNVLRWSE